jgi:hypothetical protein
VDTRTLPGEHNGIEGAEHVHKVVSIDQSPIGRVEVTCGACKGARFNSGTLDVTLLTSRQSQMGSFRQIQKRARSVRMSANRKRRTLRSPCSVNSMALKTDAGPRFLRPAARECAIVAV